MLHIFLFSLVFLYALALAFEARSETYIEQLGKPDKVGHYAAGATISALAAMSSSREQAPEMGLVSAIAVAVGKEAYDYHHKDKHKPEVADAAATILGGALVYATIKTDRLRIERLRKSTTLIWHSSY